MVALPLQRQVKHGDTEFTEDDRNTNRSRLCASVDTMRQYDEEALPIIEGCHRAFMPHSAMFLLFSVFSVPPF